LRSPCIRGAGRGFWPDQFIPLLAEMGFTGTVAQTLRELARIAGPDAARHRAWPMTPAGLEGILRRLSPPLADQGIIIEFLPPVTGGGHRLVRINLAPAPDAESGAVLAFARTTPPSTECDRVVSALRAAGVDPSWQATKAASLALLNAAGSVDLAAAALNILGIPAPDGAAWTPERLMGAI
jgi:hypothetical protein